jgi:hypothetical protein
LYADPVAREVYPPEVRFRNNTTAKQRASLRFLTCGSVDDGKATLIGRLLYVQEDEFPEIYVETPIDVCIARDPKGLYQQALAGEITNVIGVDQLYEEPQNPEMKLSTRGNDAESLAERVIEEMMRRALL